MTKNHHYLAKSFLLATIALPLALLATYDYLSAQRGPSGRSGPPAEALKACAEKQENDSCSFRTRRGERSGTCFAPPDREELACRPAGHARRGQSSGPPPTRRHMITQSTGAATLVPATEQPIALSIITDDKGQKWRLLRSNGIARHLTGKFPNAGNPHRISVQQHSYRVPAAPQLTGGIRNALGQVFGVAVNGVVFDPGANEFYQGDRSSGWQYEPLRNALNMGLDANHAHVQPQGAYHYHGLPTLLLDSLNVGAQAHSPLIGWAADGFPIYALYGDPDGLGSVVEMTSGYRVKNGSRPSGNGNPGGTYDGTFTRDYDYVQGAGNLDMCNGRFVRTPDFPDGTYAYFLTRDWPVIPRCFKGTPGPDFARRSGRQ